MEPRTLAYGEPRIARLKLKTIVTLIRHGTVLSLQAEELIKWVINLILIGLFLLLPTGILQLACIFNQNFTEIISHKTLFFCHIDSFQPDAFQFHCIPLALFSLATLNYKRTYLLSADLCRNDSFVNNAFVINCEILVVLLLQVSNVTHRHCHLSTDPSCFHVRGLFTLQQLKGTCKVRMHSTCHLL